MGQRVDYFVSFLKFFDLLIFLLEKKMDSFSFHLIFRIYYIIVVCSIKVYRYVMYSRNIVTLWIDAFCCKTGFVLEWEESGSSLKKRLILFGGKGVQSHFPGRNLIIRDGRREEYLWGTKTIVISFFPHFLMKIRTFMIILNKENSQQWPEKLHIFFISCVQKCFKTWLKNL